MKTDEVYMACALQEAKKAYDVEEVPIGAIVVHERKIIARAHNQTRLLKDPTAHAEMIALTQSANFLQSERLLNCTLYVTIEPCAMCAGAMIWARIERLVFGAFDPKAGACGSILDVIREKRLNHCIQVSSGILSRECGLLLQDFFQIQRAKGKK